MVQDRRRVDALVRVHREALGQQILGPRRPVAPRALGERERERRGPGRAAPRVAPLEGLLVLGGVEGLHAAEHDVEHAAQAPDVDLGAVGPPRALLGRDEPGRAAQRRRDAPVAVGHAEIRELDVAEQRRR